jgi:hypothetical protein
MADVTRPGRAEVIEDFYANLGIDTLARTLDADTVEARDWDDLERYCRLALTINRGLFADEQRAFLDEIGMRLAGVVAEDSHRFKMVGDESFLEIDGELVALTPEVLAHWQWLFALGTDEAQRERFLGAVPAPVRERAKHVPQQVVDAAFDSMIKRL